MPAEQEFTLILDGIPELTREVVDALHETGCDDATISRQAGRIAMDFDRTAPTLKDARALNGCMDDAGGSGLLISTRRASEGSDTKTLAGASGW